MTEFAEKDSAAQRVLHPCCRVRGEKFGLLFYDSRGPRLLFAETRDLVDANALAEGGAWEQALRPCAPRERAALGRLREGLTEKGFLREQPIC